MSDHVTLPDTNYDVYALDAYALDAHAPDAHALDAHALDAHALDTHALMHTPGCLQPDAYALGI
jgi:hypothetical protein